MKKFLATLVLGVASLAAHAEATFDQIQMLIQQQNYSAAEKGLEEIIRNHPKSAKAFYAMAQAQAGLGNQEKAKKALDIATGLNPTLDFAPQSSVASLKEAITPQVKKIESIEESHTGRNLLIVLLLVVIGGTAYVLYNRKKDEEEAERQSGLAKLKAEREAEMARQRERDRQEEAERQALRQHPNYGHDRFDPTNPDVLKPLPKKKTKAELKAEADALAIREALARAEATEAEARSARIRESASRNSGYNAQPTQTVVHTNSGSNDMLTGVLIGNMLGGHHDHHESTREVVRERVIEREAPSRSSSWDDTPSTSSSSRSSSWDDTPSTSSRSSSWDDDSSSKSSSSWSSSSSDSSSSWSDSSSSSSSSSWD
jgi:tetratricopeptide (TPR) repeat protein